MFKVTPGKIREHYSDTDMNNLWADYVIFLLSKVKPIDKKYFLNRIDDDALEYIADQLSELLEVQNNIDVDANEILRYLDGADQNIIDNIIR